MSSSTFSSLLSALDSRSIAEIASRLGAPQQTISKGLEISTAALSGGLASKAEDATWMSQLFNLVSHAPSHVNVLEIASAVIDPSRVSSATTSLLESGKKFLSLAFGSSQSSVFGAVATSTGLSSGGVSSLMGIAAPFMMTALGRLVREDHMTPEGLARVLAHEGQDARESLPADITRFLDGTSEVMTPAKPIPTATASARPLSITTVSEPTTPSRAWFWLIPLLLIPLLFYWVDRVRHRMARVTVIHPIVVQRVPSRVFLNIPKDTVGARLLAFVQDPSTRVDQGTRFEFDSLLFDTNSAVLQPGAREQLGYLAAILKAYPNVHLTIGGHTDSTGTSQQNLRLSQERANRVKAELVAMGISPDRLEAKGFGAQIPVSDNATAPGRAMNRRISVTVTQK